MNAPGRPRENDVTPNRGPTAKTMRSHAALPALAALALLAGACRQQATQPATTGKDSVAATADQIVFGMQQKVTNEGVRKADLRSDTAFTRPNDPVVRLRGVRLVFFDENGKQSGQLTSRTGEYNSREGTMIARGNAVLILSGEKGPRTIRTEELHYETKADRVWSDKATTMAEAGQTYNGNSFQSDTKFTNVTVQQLRTSGMKTGSAKEEFKF